MGGTTANTPSELKPVYMHGRNLQGLSPLKPVYMHGRNLQGLSPLPAQIGGARPQSDAGGTLANTPTELSGGIILVNGHKRTVPLS